MRLWEPGSWGKGLWVDGELHHWTVASSSLNGSAPHHNAILRQLGHNFFSPEMTQAVKENRLQFLQITPAGQVRECLQGTKVDPGVMAADPRLHVSGPDGQDEWRFGKVVDHNINWKPGQRGRAVVDEHGAIHVWTGGPSHAEYASREGLQPRSFYFVSPQGNVTTGAKDYAHDGAVIGEHLRTAAFIPPDRPPEVVELTHDQLNPMADFDAKAYENHMPDYLKPRRPFVYWPEDHQVVIGPPGTVHSQILPKHDPHGYRADVGIVSPIHGVTSFGDIPGTVLDHLSERFGISRDGDKEWKFASNTLDWAPGSFGKGVVTRDNDVYLWTVDASDGRPNHVRGCLEYGIDSGNCRTFISVSPEGEIRDVTFADVDHPPTEPDLQLVADLIDGTVGGKGYGTEWVFN